MVAVFDVSWDYGGTADTPGTTSESVTNLRFNNEDTNDQDTASPLTITSATNIYSYWKHVYLECTTAPDTQCDNFNFYSDGSSGLGTGITINVGDGTQTKNSGSSAGYDPGANTVMTNHDTITTVTDVFTYNSGSPRTVSCSEAGSLINDIGETTDYLVLQALVVDTASPGTTPTETLTFSYDEI